MVSQRPDWTNISSRVIRGSIKFRFWWIWSTEGMGSWSMLKRMHPFYSHYNPLKTACCFCSMILFVCPILWIFARTTAPVLGTARFRSVCFLSRDCWVSSHFLAALAMEDNLRDAGEVWSLASFKISPELDIFAKITSLWCEQIPKGSGLFRVH